VRFIVIPDDDLVYYNGEPRFVDCLPLMSEFADPDQIQAIHFDNEDSGHEIEYKANKQSVFARGFGPLKKLKGAWFAAEAVPFEQEA